MPDDRVALCVPRALVELVMLGPADDQRQLQDSPILGDVWLAYAQQPTALQDVLITPHRHAAASRVARVVSEGISAMNAEGKTAAPDDRPLRWSVPQDEQSEATRGARIAYLQGLVAARLFFDELLRIVVPVTLWWNQARIRAKLNEEYTAERIRGRVGELFDSLVQQQSRVVIEPLYFSALERYIAMAGLILWASRQPPPKAVSAAAATVEEILEQARRHLDEIVQELATLFERIKSDWEQGWASKFFLPKKSKGPRKQAALDDSVVSVIFQVSLNRRAIPAVDKSVPAVKADAARTLFKVCCHRITWAVLDSGIDGGHEAFLDAAGKSRVRKTFDFTRIRDIVSRDDSDDMLERARIQRLIRGTRLSEREARALVRRLAADADSELPLNWGLIEKFVLLEEPNTPTNVHGTHVAGILAAADEKGRGYGVGMCPDVQLYDFRVLARELDDTEFAIIAALQYIRYVNELHSSITVHGANLSLSIPHNVRNYACGRTPLCSECERLVESGVVVVAAAGNRGYQYFETQNGAFENYAAFSVTDPGNADGVITVGSTHRNWPHTYGVSYFSSRGPTGDGRLKPDLVAPGERIHGPMPEGQWGYESGTSMAAPHVSGAAAMLMARYPELIGQPRRIKRILCETATDLDRERSFQGHGMLDVLRAFQSV
jgi:hypothetical protein